jgi:hypothetical protein
MAREQSYQEVFKVILRELVESKVNLKEVDPHEYFYILKSEYPKRYQRLTFDTNRAEPFSETLEEILGDFRVCVFIDFDNKIVSSSIDKIMECINSKYAVYISSKQKEIAQ